MQTTRACRISAFPPAAVPGTSKTSRTPVTVFQRPSRGRLPLRHRGFGKRRRTRSRLSHRGRAGAQRSLHLRHLARWLPDPRFTGFIVPQGSRWTLECSSRRDWQRLQRRDRLGGQGPARRGVTMIAPRFGKGVTRMPVQFVAAARTPSGKPRSSNCWRGQPIRGALDSGSRQGFALTNRPGELPWHFVWLDKFASRRDAARALRYRIGAARSSRGARRRFDAERQNDRHGDFTAPWKSSPIGSRPAFRRATL